MAVRASGVAAGAVGHSAGVTGAGTSLWATVAAGASAGAGPAASFMEWLGLGSTAHIVVGIFGCVILLIFIATLVAMIPTLRTLDRVAAESELLLRDVRKEIPATLAALRRSSGEIADLASEVEDIATDIGRGFGGGMHAVKVTATLVRSTWAGFMAGVKNGMILRQKYSALQESRRAKAGSAPAAAAAHPAAEGGGTLGGPAAAREGASADLKSVASTVARPVARRLASLVRARSEGAPRSRGANRTAAGEGRGAAHRVRSSVKKMLSARKNAALKRARDVQVQMRSPGYGYPTTNP